MRRRDREPTQLVIDTSMGWYIGAGLFLLGVFVSDYVKYRFPDLARWGDGPQSELVLQATEEVRLSVTILADTVAAQGRELESLRLIYRELQEDHHQATEADAQAWGLDARREAVQDVKIENLDTTVTTHLNGGQE